MNKEFPFVIMTIPERKKPCLFWKESETCLVKIASFNDDKSRDIFIKEMNKYLRSLYV